MVRGKREPPETAGNATAAGLNGSIAVLYERGLRVRFFFRRGLRADTVRGGGGAGCKIRRVVDAR